jgi:methylmalonyl-CoA mutase C-terminal domain/subunit
MKKIRVLIGILGLDQHDLGAVGISRMLRDAGMEVIYAGKFNLPPMIVNAGIEENVDLIGLSCHSWEYLYYLPELIDLLKKKLDIPIIVGGSVITPKDSKSLIEMGVAAAFGPSATSEEMIECIKGLVAKKQSEEKLKMSAERLFTDEELKTLGQRTLDLLEDALGKGENENAKKLALRMYSEFLGMHDLYRDWVTHLLTFIGERYGDDVLAEALQETVSGYTRRLAKHYTGKDTRSKIAILLAGFRGHLQPLDIEEDDEKLTITPKPCGSGGRLIQGGGYQAPCNFLKIKKPQTMTFNRPEFPVYCVHCHFKI